MLDTEYNEAEVMEMFKEDGRKEGRIEGIDEHLVGQVCKKLAKGKDKNVIAEELEEDADRVGAIIGVAADFAPDYDAEKTFEAYMALQPKT